MAYNLSCGSRGLVEDNFEVEFQLNNLCPWIHWTIFWHSHQPVSVHEHLLLHTCSCNSKLWIRQHCALITLPL